MALRRTLAKRLYNLTRNQSPVIGTVEHFISPSSRKSLNAAKADFHRELLTSPESSSTADPGFFRRFLQRRKINQSSSSGMSLQELFYFPAGEKLREKLNISSADRLRLDGLMPPVTEKAHAQPNQVDSVVGISVLDARKILRGSQLQKVRSALKQMPANSITYSEFINFCSDCGSNHDQGLEFAKLLDEAGDVIVLGNIVFLHPDQVAKSVEKLISQSIATPNDPRKKELKELEQQKAFIDRKAVSQVRGELYCGLGFLIVQTLGFMRLTFWELSWDVMEPICFFVTSFHFALAYMFFLRTSKEPTFEGFFQRRFRVKQRKLMEAYNFDSVKYNELCAAFYPNRQTGFGESRRGGSHAAVFG